ncbi:MAG: Crp/Fnr family transcriptional regulator [Bosea sp. (in: a-proteobacteria)]|uniref:Crp/Fnr family transcriptional regulator n=1 Tax=Bosea sp. (in: a-proteobacteria) TaxID=1871050 RepID=UPI002733BA6B|nr:Crp/Fnr family transcriptional regulator [Bosea sp. (in: a-proteobacteria)]MDP3257846.1 Crp/Fnr family transcriptional regulator [Bosea sp. (in: a-proteobacteria)]MDP3319396.1 Crp/Fnr family transcriptional regulator [Bosea sp. (in: a-proteobacteria)]
METAAIAAMLGEAGFFAGVPPQDLLDCAAEFREQRFDAGQMLFARGDAGDRLLLVVEGRVRLSVTTEEGRELSMRHAARGDLLGEIAVLDGGTRSADAVAITPVLALSLRRAALDTLRARHPALAAGIIAFLCRRLRQTTDQLEGIALYSIEVRLARFLLVGLGGRRAPAGKRVPFDLAFSQGELAQLLGASRPKVNAALGSLEQMGAIRRTADRLFCDPDLLAKCAGIEHG